MNISWIDLNNVEESGDYPFRDGIITVSFAEIAIWKKRPGAKFELMRKHPIRSTVNYVLGRQIDENSDPIGTELFYESSNGDSWSLVWDPTTEARAVMHRPNPPSGGQISYISIKRFLNETANGPEHQALRQLLESKPRVGTMLIAYDIHPSRGKAYDSLVQGIQSLGNWWHHLETVWIVQCEYTPTEIRDRLGPHIGEEDQLLVIDIYRDAAKWVGVNDAGSKWLAENI
jgi:hypothetical protein